MINFKVKHRQINVQMNNVLFNITLSLFVYPKQIHSFCFPSLFLSGKRYPILKHSNNIYNN